MFMANHVFHTVWDSDVYTVLKDRYYTDIDHWKELEELGIQDVALKGGRASFRMSEDALLILALVL